MPKTPIDISSGFITCKKCGETKEIKQFRKYRNRKGIQKFKGICRDCVNIYRKNWRINIGENSDIYLDNILKDRLSSIRKRCKENNFEYDLDVDFLKSIYTGICPVLNTPIFFKSKHNKITSENIASIDRINSNRGYTKDNVMIISGKANLIKNFGNLEDHKKIVSWLEKLQKEGYDV